jgi:hypothetical protein
MNTPPTHFLFYDQFEEKWLQASLAELASRNDPELYVIPVCKDEQGDQCTWGEWLESKKARDLEIKEKKEEIRRKLEANKPVRYEYEVICHTKYKGLLAEYDTEGLKEKINALAQEGYRLVSSTNIVTSAASPLQGVVAILERTRK